MHVVVTGSSGRLGRSLCAGLAASGHLVTGVDRAPAGLDGVDERGVDLLDQAATEALLGELRPDAVVHLAGIAVPFSAPEREILVTNTTLAHTVLAAAAGAGVKRVLAASSPTVIGYSSPAWRASAVPIDEVHPVEPANAYALSKAVIEETVRMFSRTAAGAYGFFRPCYVVSPEEWAGAPTQQGHTLLERLADPALAAVSLFNYLDARDAAAFVDAWLTAPADAIDGEGFFVGAADALATRPVAELWREFAPGLGDRADALDGTQPVFSSRKALDRLGWRPERSWRTEIPAASVTGAPSVAGPADGDRPNGSTRRQRQHSRGVAGEVPHAGSAAAPTPSPTPQTATTEARTA